MGITMHRINREARINHDLSLAGRARLRTVIMTHTNTTTADGIRPLNKPIRVTSWGMFAQSVDHGH
jgi:hypothetical protein